MYAKLNDPNEHIEEQRSSNSILILGTPTGLCSQLCWTISVQSRFRRAATILHYTYVLFGFLLEHVQLPFMSCMASSNRLKVQAASFLQCVCVRSNVII